MTYSKDEARFIKITKLFFKNDLIQAKLKTSKNVSIIYNDSVYPYEEDGSFNVSIIDSLDNPVAQFYFVDNNVIL